MEKNGEGEFPFSAPHFDRVRTSLVHLLRDHGREGTWLQNLRSVTNNYQVSFKASYWERMIHPQLAAFDRDMKVHLHLENNILFPKALEAAEKAL